MYKPYEEEKTADIFNIIISKYKCGTHKTYTY